MSIGATHRAEVFRAAFKEKLMGAETRLNELGITLPPCRSQSRTIFPSDLLETSYSSRVRVRAMRKGMY
jgi:hypothetical protein